MVDFSFLVFAFSVGLISFFNPCGSFVLVSYFTNYFSQKKKAKRNPIFSGISGGIFATLGLLTIFVTLGIVLTIFGRGLAAYVPYFVAFMGAFLILVGFLILFHKNIFFAVNLRSTLNLDKPTGFYKYGIMYSLASFGCQLPLFLTVVFGAISIGTFYDGIVSFFVYGIAVGLAMTIVMTVIATSKSVVLKFFKKILPHMDKINAAVLILVGIYLIAFQFYYGNIIFTL